MVLYSNDDSADKEDEEDDDVDHISDTTVTNANLRNEISPLFSLIAFDTPYQQRDNWVFPFLINDDMKTLYSDILALISLLNVRKRRR